MGNIEEEKALLVYMEAKRLEADNDIDNAIKSFKEARAMFSSIYGELNDTVLHCYLHQATNYLTKGKIDYVYVLLHLSAMLAKKINFANIQDIMHDLEKVTDVLYDLIQEKTKSSDVELLNYMQQLLMLNECNDYVNDANFCYKLLSDIEDREGDRELAVEYMKLTIDNLENYEDINIQHIAKCYENMGHIYTKDGKLEKAIECYNKFSQILKDVIDVESEDYIYYYVDLIRTYIYMKDLLNASKYYDILEEILERKYQDSVNTLNMALEIGDTYFDISEYDKAIKPYKMALKAAREVFKDAPDEIDGLQEMLEHKFKQNKQEDLFKQIL